jgi:hypothetical protein
MFTRPTGITQTTLATRERKREREREKKKRKKKRKEEESYFTVLSISCLALFQSASYVGTTGWYGCRVDMAVPDAKVVFSCSSARIAFLIMLIFLIVQNSIAKAMARAIPSTAPTAAPTTVAEGDTAVAKVDAAAVTVVVAVVFVLVEADEAVPGTVLLMKRPRKELAGLFINMLVLLQQLVVSDESLQHHVSSEQGSTL